VRARHERRPNRRPPDDRLTAISGSTPEFRFERSARRRKRSACGTALRGCVAWLTSHAETAFIADGGPCARLRFRDGPGTATRGIALGLQRVLAPLGSAAAATRAVQRARCRLRRWPAGVRHGVPRCSWRRRRQVPGDDRQGCSPLARRRQRALAADDVLPGARVRRALFWRYLLSWRAPTFR
jgi:hypothetical protein